MIALTRGENFARRIIPVGSRPALRRETRFGLPLTPNQVDRRVTGRRNLRLP